MSNEKNKLKKRMIEQLKAGMTTGREDELVEFFEKFNSVFDQMHARGTRDYSERVNNVLYGKDDWENFEHKNRVKPSSSRLLWDFARYIKYQGVENNSEYLNDTGLKILSLCPHLDFEINGMPIEYLFDLNGLGQLAYEIRVLKAIRNNEDLDFLDKRDLNHNIYRRHYFKDYDISEMFTDLDMQNSDDYELFYEISKGLSDQISVPIPQMIAGKQFIYEKASNQAAEEKQEGEIDHSIISMNARGRLHRLHRRENISSNDVINEAFSKETKRKEFQLDLLNIPFDPNATPKWNWSQSTTNDLFKIFACEIKSNCTVNDPERIKMLYNIGRQILTMKPELNVERRINGESIIESICIRGEPVNQLFTGKGLGRLYYAISTLQSNQKKEALALKEKEKEELPLKEVRIKEASVKYFSQDVATFEKTQRSSSGLKNAFKAINKNTNQQTNSKESEPNEKLLSIGKLIKENDNSNPTFSAKLITNLFFEFASKNADYLKNATIEGDALNSLIACCETIGKTDLVDLKAMKIDGLGLLGMLDSNGLEKYTALVKSKYVEREYFIPEQPCPDLDEITPEDYDLLYKTPAELDKIEFAEELKDDSHMMGPK